MKNLIITGIRGIPAAHGGFETFAESLAIYLVGKGWSVTVYCQVTSDEFAEVTESFWQGVKLIHIPVKDDGAKATIVFDYLSVQHAKNLQGIILTLGYNTAIFNLLFRLAGKTNLINMDGIEWKRDKWKWYERAWLYINERVGCKVAHHLVADHPEIKKHLATRVNPNKITMIPYGARAVETADVKLIHHLGLVENGYAILIARPEPENSIFEVVSAFSRKLRGIKLVVLGKYSDSNAYHVKVRAAASDEVLFLGAIYDHAVLDALRYCALFYVHGHTVGGTNPSLIEALGAGQPILAHDNLFNRWVAGQGAMYFSSLSDCSDKLDELLANRMHLAFMSQSSREQFNHCFTQSSILYQYEYLLEQWLDVK